MRPNEASSAAVTAVVLFAEMTVRTKLLLIFIFVALVPLSISAFSAVRVHQSAFDGQFGAAQRSEVVSRVRLTEQFLQQVHATLASVAGSIEWSDLSAEERQGAQWLVFRSLDDVVVVQLVDEKGVGIGTGAFVEDANSRGLGSHVQASRATLQAFSKSMVLATSGVHVGVPFPNPDGGPPVLPLGVAVRGKNGATWTLAVALSLRGLCELVADFVSEPMVVYLADDNRQSLCATSTTGPRMTTAQENQKPTRLDGTDGVWLATGMSVAGRWQLVAQQPEAVVTAASRRIQMQTAFWVVVSLFIALLGGWLLSREISRPLAKLTTGANELAAGRLGYRLNLPSSDEFGRLGEAFNRMSGEIQARDVEIRSWNEQLQRRVDEQTRDLKDAQAQLVHSQKMASVMSLASGVAHEINNPLTSVLGMAQLFRMRLEKSGASEKEVKALNAIEREGKRIRDIVAALQTLASEQTTEGFAPMKIEGALDRAVDLVAGRLAEKGIVLEREYEEALPEALGNQAQIEQVILHLLNNALAACDPQGKIVVSAENIDDRVLKLTVRDDGRGIPKNMVDRVFDPFFTTKHDWEGRGLGLTIAFRVVNEHHGRIRIDSEVGEGTTVSVFLPIHRAASVLY